jgi:hypothetical protein
VDHDQLILVAAPIKNAGIARVFYWRLLNGRFDQFATVQKRKATDG